MYRDGRTADQISASFWCISFCLVHLRPPALCLHPPVSIFFSGLSLFHSALALTSATFASLRLVVAEECFNQRAVHGSMRLALCSLTEFSYQGMENYCRLPLSRNLILSSVIKKHVKAAVGAPASRRP